MEETLFKKLCGLMLNEDPEYENYDEEETVEK